MEGGRGEVAARKTRPVPSVQFRKVPVAECEHTATVTATIPEDSGRSETLGFVGSDLTAYRTWLAVPATLGLSLRTPSVAKDDDLTIFAQRIVSLRQRNAILPSSFTFSFLGTLRLSRLRFRSFDLTVSTDRGIHRGFQS